MADDKIQLPMSGGGLVRYSDEAASKFMFNPSVVVYMIIIVILIEIILHMKLF